MPTARDVPETGTRASDLSDGSRGIPRMPSCTEYNRNDPTPADHKLCFEKLFKYLSQQHHSMGTNTSYPHKTAALCAGCILLCTCRLWWLGRWVDTAGNSLHCYYCRDWCLETQKHENKYTPQIKEE